MHHVQEHINTLHAKYGLKIHKNPKILELKKFKKRGNQLKRGTLTPLL